MRTATPLPSTSTVPSRILQASPLATLWLVCVLAAPGCGGSLAHGKGAEGSGSAAIIDGADCESDGLTEPAAPDNPYVLTKTTRLCSNAVYRRGFEIGANNVELDCRGATISFRSQAGSAGTKSRRAVSIGHVEGAMVHDCRIEGTEGVMVHGKGAKLWKLTVRGSSATGIHVLGPDNTITDCTITKSDGSGIYLGTGSARTLVKSNSITSNGIPAREGIAIDSSYMNRIEDNQLMSNGAAGITLYRNCGESGGSPRPHESYGNVIIGNSIAGHSVGVKKSVASQERTRFRGTGIAVGWRQGDTLIPQQDFTCHSPLAPRCQSARRGLPIPPGTKELDRVVGVCNDDSYQRFDWASVDLAKPVLQTPIAEPGGRMRLISSQHVMYANEKNRRTIDQYRSTFLLDRHFDFAPRTQIDSNTIFDNDVGILVADQETTITRNTFHANRGPGNKDNSFADILVGNGFVDRLSLTRADRGQPVLRSYVRNMSGNVFGTSAKRSGSVCVATTDFARQRVLGEDARHCATNRFFDYDFARTYEAEGTECQHPMGHRTDEGWAIGKGEGKPGLLLATPSTTDIPQGRRTVEAWVSLSQSERDRQVAMTMDVFDATANRVLVTRTITRSEWGRNRTEQFAVAFENQNLHHALSFRVWWAGEVPLEVDRITVH